MVATYDNSRVLKIYRIVINWQYKEPAKDQPPSPPPDPIVDIQPQILETSCAPLRPNQTDQSGNGAAGVDALSDFMLTHLEMIPVTPTRTNEVSQPTVVATFISVPASAAMNLDISQKFQGATSVVCRWNMKQGPEIYLPSVFDEITNRKIKLPDGREVKPSEVPLRVGKPYRIPNLHLTST